MKPSELESDRVPEVLAHQEGLADTPATVHGDQLGARGRRGLLESGTLALSPDQHASIISHNTPHDNGYG